MRRFRPWLAMAAAILVGLAAVAGGPAAALGQDEETAEPAEKPAAAAPVKVLTPKAVDEAVRNGVQYLEKLLASEEAAALGPAAATSGTLPGETEAVAALGLTGAGCDVKDADMGSALEALLITQPDNCETISFRVISLGRVLKKLDEADRRKALAVLTKDLEALAKAQRETGGWGLLLSSSPVGGAGRGRGGGGGGGGWTFPATRYALEAFAGAERAGVLVRPEAFLKAEKLFLGSQRADGGWGGRLPGLPGQLPPEIVSLGADTASAAIALSLVRRVGYRGAGCPCRSEKSDRRTEKLDAALERGLGWLGENFSASGNPGQGPKVGAYAWFEACYEAAAATGCKQFGEHDWWREISPALVRSQNDDGSWGEVPEGGRASVVTWDTAEAVSILHWGRMPVAINKLRFAGPWNNHPADVANLTEVLNEGWKETARWQVVDESAKAESWQDAPLLFISAEAAPALGDEVKKKLRAFTDGGGTVLLEASCGERKTVDGWRKTAAEVWPEWPMQKADKDHPVWTAEAKIVKALPTLFAIDDGMRSSVFFSAGDISCAWAMNDTKGNRPLFELGGNVRAYAADGASPAEWAAAREAGPAGRYARETADLRKGRRTTVTVARVKHAGEWACGMNYQPWQALASSVAASVSGLALRESAAVDLAAGAPTGVDCLYLCGRTGCDVGEAGGKALRQYLAGGGFLFVEASAGDVRFQLAFDAFQNATGLAAKPLAADDPLATGKFPAPARGYAIKEVRWSAALAAQMKEKSGIGLLGLYDGEKLVGVYSPYDVMFSQTGCRAFGLRGYAADDARAVATNVVIMLTGR